MEEAPSLYTIILTGSLLVNNKIKKNGLLNEPDAFESVSLK